MAQPDPIKLVINCEFSRPTPQAVEIYASSAAQAIRGLIVNFPWLRKEITERDNYGVCYRLRCGEHEIGLCELHHPITGTLVFEEVIGGAGAGLKILAGAALIGASFAIPGAGAAAGITLAKGALLSVGASLAFGGLAQLFTPQPKERKDESFLFGNATQTSQQGKVIGLLIGEIYTPVTDMIVLSSSIDSSDIPIESVSSSGKGGK